MNERIKELAKHHLVRDEHTEFGWRECHKYEFDPDELEKFAELIQEDMYRKVIASILITDVVMEEKGQVPTSEDYILAINKDFGVKE